ncbi:MAG: LysR family transcriptional regulator [Burkholderiales bacterium]
MAVAGAQARLRVRVQFGDGFAMGPGKADLLQAVVETGSISAAARQMKMSYRRAWLLIDAMNQCFREPVVDTATGGKGGGGAQITPFGRLVLKDFRAMEAGAIASVEKRMPEFSRLLRKTPPAGKIY